MVHAGCVNLLAFGILGPGLGVDPCPIALDFPIEVRASADAIGRANLGYHLASGDGIADGNRDVINVDELVFYWPMPILPLNVNLETATVGRCSNLANLADPPIDRRGHSSPRRSSYAGIKINPAMRPITALVASLRAKALPVAGLVGNQVF